MVKAVAQLGVLENGFRTGERGGGRGLPHCKARVWYAEADNVPVKDSADYSGLRRTAGSIIQGQRVWER